ncbi:hypothetical protein OIDMADRAFT_22960 [Oidiodendron maius Zn]|uniref:Uncharacterized protein n=1 Tax=Oidiodendron maius (strain Zn) TaxID=913774 RepID=A0A0C3D9Z0_OIDMZ|nr:hypothetical protein OIDMADRAFT_22960 [Oidiodendron maius Zn]
MRMFLQATALALAIGTALGNLGLDVVYGVMPRATSNLQNFTGALGGVAAEPITLSGDSQRPFAVDGETFTTLSAAVERSCGIQHNGCSDTANSGHDGQDGSGLTVGMCDTQQTSCVDGGSSSATTSPPASTTEAFAAITGTPQSSDANFFYFCDS